MTWIAKQDIYSGVQRAFAKGDEVPDWHVKTYGWTDMVQRKQVDSVSEAPSSKEVKK